MKATLRESPLTLCSQENGLTTTQSHTQTIDITKILHYVRGLYIFVKMVVIEE